LYAKNSIKQKAEKDIFLHAEQDINQVAKNERYSWVKNNDRLESNTVELDIGTSIQIDAGGTIKTTSEGGIYTTSKAQFRQEVERDFITSSRGRITLHSDEEMMLSTNSQSYISSSSTLNIAGQEVNIN